MSIQDFSSFHELFIVFNLSYVGIDNVKHYVNNKMLGLNKKRKAKIASIATDIESLKVMQQDDISPHDLNKAKKELTKFSGSIETIHANFQKSFSSIYLVGGIFGLITIYWQNYQPIESLYNGFMNLSFSTLIFMTLLSYCIAFLKVRTNSLWTVVIYLIIIVILITIEILEVYLIKMTLSEDLTIHLINFVMVFPFILNFCASLKFGHILDKDLKKIESLYKTNFLESYNFSERG